MVQVLTMNRLEQREGILFSSSCDVMLGHVENSKVKNMTSKHVRKHTDRNIKAGGKLIHGVAERIIAVGVAIMQGLELG